MRGAVGLAAGAVPAMSGRAARRWPTGRLRSARGRAAPAPKYGPQTPGERPRLGRQRHTQDDVPAISARCRSSVAASPRKAAQARRARRHGRRSAPAPTRQSPASGRARRRPPRVSGPRSAPTGARARRQRRARAGRRGRPLRGNRACQPGVLMRQIGPLAGERALRAGRIARWPARSGSRRGRRAGRRAPRSRAGGASATSASAICHLRRHDAADIVEHRGGRWRCIRRPRRWRGGRARAMVSQRSSPVDRDA